MKHSKHSSTASKQVNQARGFRIHLLVFLITTPLIWLVWYLTDRSYIWPLWSTPAWLVGIIFHYLGINFFKNFKK